MSSLSSDRTKNTLSAAEMSAPTCPDLSFETLPRELRNFIYAELWNHTPVIKARYRGVHMQMRFQATKSAEQAKEKIIRMHNLPIWLRTCKMVLHEGLEELRVKSTWTVGPYHAPCSQTLHRRSGFAPRDTGQLFDPTVAGRLTLWTNSLELDPHQPTDKATFRMETDDVEYIRTLAVRLHVASRVRTLRLKARVDPCCNACYRRYQAKGWHVDLANLTHLPIQLESLEFEVVRAKKVPGDRAEDWVFCPGFFAREIERVGRVLVGEGVLTVQVLPGLQDWYDTFLFRFSNIEK
ncbi:hypothetical protein N0V95_003489 [Ascochyta clinopodiicola]|nr:hypothetical protein N0V95_003489 [Ascochyta clinopodiicola]